MNNIVGIIDMDGFRIEKKFYCKELGIIKTGDDTASSYLFDLGIKWNDLSDKDKRQCAFLTKHIHKLQFDVAQGSKAFQLTNLDHIVKTFYNDLKVNEQSLIAYKGGQIELELLRNLHIPSVNLETYGCPKLDLIIDELVWIETCGHRIGRDSYRHCPKVEVEAFNCWMKKEQMNIM